jgi:uncharacterized membrane protein
VRDVQVPDGTESPLLGAVRRVEDDDRLDAVTAPLRRAAGSLARGRARAVLGGAWLGHALHPLLTDFPLGCWIGAGLLDVLGGGGSQPAARRLVGLGVLFTIPTAAAGLSDWCATEDPRVRRVGGVHALINGAVAASYLWSWRSRRRGRRSAAAISSLVGGSLAWISGYLGGHLSLRLGAGTGEPA